MKVKNLILSAIVLLGMVAGATTQVVDGEAWNGAKYQLVVPDHWNGDLVVYAHGYINQGLPLEVPTVTGQDRTDEIADMLVSNGYAFACSSYSANGFAVQEGTLDTLCLNWHFKKQFGKPDRTFLLGHSLGGAICVQLAESLPKHYDGVLTFAGMIGGSQAEIDYISNIRVMTDFFYGHALPGSIDHVPDGLDLTNDIIVPLATAIAADPTGAAVIAYTDQTAIPFADPAELGASIIYATVFYYSGHSDLAIRTGTPTFFTNADTAYTSPAMPPEVMDLVNASVVRVEASRYAERYFQRNYEPTGKLKVPMLGIQNSRDPIIPAYIHQTRYAEKVAKRGYSENLVQRVVERHGHTDNITPEEVVDAFEELIDWVDTGIAPETP